MEISRPDQGGDETNDNAANNDLLRAIPSYNPINWQQNPSDQSLISPSLFISPWQEPYSINDAFSRFNLNVDTPVPAPALAPVSQYPMSSYFPQVPSPVPAQFSFNRAVNNQTGQNPVLGSSMINDPYALSLEQELERDIQIREALLQMRYSQLRAYQGYDGFDKLKRQVNRGGFVSENVGHCEKSCCYHKKQQPNKGYSHNQRFESWESSPGYLRKSNSVFSRYLYLLQQHTEIVNMEELRGYVIEMTKDQNGCRFLQKKFEEGKKEDIELIFSELKDGISELMVNPFGNYLVPKLLEVCNDQQITEMLCSMSRNECRIVYICLDPYGTRSMQKLMDHISEHPQLRSWFMSAVRPGVKRLSMNNNGHHIIQLCLQKFNYEDYQYLLETVASNCVEIGTNQYGCCVVQKSLEYSHGETKARILTSIIESALALSQDEYGNYVVQYLLGLNVYTKDLLAQLEGSFVSLSMQKFSSNVVEKFLKEAKPEYYKRIVKELIYSPDVLMLLQDAFGNYVIQSALDITFKGRGPLFNSILNIVQLHFPSLRNHLFGKRVITKVNQLTRRV
ncbi:hypothetical protein GIB67_033828 [Kingdonia uniflora]|uniref:PUM-HD domain-containing protein n=1 Tax=Kingdonia uniflora TaxID=39325 RepID=A0A7J7LI99_9MAGN|nr:hypothetical protein GIB67_033828 [Kingdonia uniflora]